MSTGTNLAVNLTMIILTSLVLPVVTRTQLVPRGCGGLSRSLIILSSQVATGQITNGALGPGPAEFSSRDAALPQAAWPLTPYGVPLFMARISTGTAGTEGLTLFLLGALFVAVGTLLRLKIVRRTDRETGLGFSRNVNS